MSAYGSFHRIFENSRQDKSPKSLLDTLSSSSTYNPTKGLHDNNKSLQLCTEGLGSESYYDLEVVKVNVNFNRNVEDNENEVKGKDEELVRRRKERREYPPAMMRMSFKTYREEGRLVVEEVRIARREFLQASREDGRLKLKLIQHEDEDEVELEDQVKSV